MNNSETKNREYKFECRGYNFDINTNSIGGGGISSDIFEDDRENEDAETRAFFDGAREALESFILSYACASGNPEEEKFQEALSTAIDCVCQ